MDSLSVLPLQLMECPGSHRVEIPRTGHHLDRLGQGDYRGDHLIIQN